MNFEYQKKYNRYWATAPEKSTNADHHFDALAEKITLTTAGKNFLDIGTGQGALVFTLLREGFDAHGVDVSDVAVTKSNAIAPGRFDCASVLSLPFGDKEFDVVIAVDCLDHLLESDVVPAVQEISRVCSSTVYVRIDTSPLNSNSLRETAKARRWWEDRFFEVGFRKHPSYYQLNSYESLENEVGSIEMLLERIPEAAVLKYPLRALAEERDLHMDMFRESGSRSDAHVMRYQWATQFIRPGDTVLDAACGLGYGSYLIQSSSTAKRTLGIDGSAYAVDYAQQNYAAKLGDLEFRLGMLPEALAALADQSIDVVISFETLEHVEENTLLLAEFHRVLTPGGRIVASVPNDWSDESGEDPNPFHVHVYTLERLRSEMEKLFVLEALAAQDANQHKAAQGSKEWKSAPRRLKAVPLSAVQLSAEPTAEWWLSVAMKSPIDAADKATYQETTYPVFSRPDWHVTTFAQDYHKPWIVRTMVDTGHRLRDPNALARLAEKVIAQTTLSAPDVGAALCVLAYQLLGDPEVTAAQVNAIESKIDAYLASGPQTPHGVRWRVSLLFVLGKLWMAHGDLHRSELSLKRCVSVDPLDFSPLLSNRTVEAWLSLGKISLGRNDLIEAEQRFHEGIRQARRAVVDGWDTAMGDVANPAEFAHPELASILELASSCAFALANLKDFGKKTWWWLHPRRDRISQNLKLQREYLHTLAELHKSNEELQKYSTQAEKFHQELQAGKTAVAAMRSTIVDKENELDQYRQQAEEFSRQIKHFQLHSEQTHIALLHRETELESLRIHVAAKDEELKLASGKWDTELENLRTHVVQRNQEITALTTKVQDFESQLSAIKSSRTWRLASAFSKFSGGRK